MTFSTDQSESEEAIEGVSPVYGLYQSETTHQPPAKYFCKFCKFGFRRKDALDRHIFHHTNEVRF